MANFFARFNKSWASSGDVDDPTDAEAAQGWNYIGPAPPTVEQFNSIGQWLDDKDSWLYNQINYCVLQGLAVPPNATDQTTLWRAIQQVYQIKLGFIPVQQGGGAGQGTNKVYLGWAADGLRVQVDATNLGPLAFLQRPQTWTQPQVYNAIVTVNANIYGYDISASNNILAGQHVSATLDVYAGRSVGAVGNVTAGQHVTATYDITAGRNIHAGGTLSAAGHISGPSIATTGSGGISAGGSLVARLGPVYVSFDVTGGGYYLHADGSNCTINFQTGWALIFNRSTGHFTYLGAGTPRVEFTPPGNIIAHESLTFRNSSLTAAFGVPNAGAFRFLSNGTGQLHQWGVNGWGSILSYNTPSLPSGGGAWACDVVGNTTQAGNCAATGFPIISDVQLKQKIEPWAPGLDVVNKIETVSFEYTGDSKVSAPGVKHYGVTAQQLREVFPEAVTIIQRDLTSKPITEDGDYSEYKPNLVEHLAVDPHVMLMACINAIKEMSARIEELETKHGK